MPINQVSNCYSLSFSSRIWDCRWQPSLNVMAEATIGLFMPQARPSTALLSMKQYGILLSSQRGGRVMTTSRGSQSAAMITHSTSFLEMALRHSLTPFLTCLWVSNCWSNSRTFLVSLASATGSGFNFFSTFSCLSTCSSFSSFSASPKISTNSSYYLPDIPTTFLIKYYKKHNLKQSKNHLILLT